MSKRKKKPERPLTDQQKKAVAMYYDYDPRQEIAAACGVHRTTIWRWSKTRAFWREWKRIDYNNRRKWERRDAKRRAEEDAYWEEEERKAKAKLDELSAKITTKPGKEWYKALHEYEKAQLRGKTLAERLAALSRIKW